MKKAAITLLSLFLFASCTSLSTLEKTKLAELEANGIRVPHEEVKNPGAAGALNILPGFGNFYLAIGTNESEHWAYGFINLLLWPLSVVWSVPEAAIDATTINKRNTVYYYSFGPGVQEIQRASAPAPVVPASLPAVVPAAAPAAVPAATAPAPN